MNRKRSHEDLEDADECLPISKRINSLHLEGKAQRNGGLCQNQLDVNLLQGLLNPERASFPLPTSHDSLPSPGTLFHGETPLPLGHHGQNVGFITATAGAHKNSTHCGRDASTSIACTAPSPLHPPQGFQGVPSMPMMTLHSSGADNPVHHHHHFHPHPHPNSCHQGVFLNNNHLSSVGSQEIPNQFHHAHPHPSQVQPPLHHDRNGSELFNVLYTRIDNPSSNMAGFGAMHENGLSTAVEHSDEVLPSGPYDPELDVSENPHYYRMNKLLYEAHLFRIQRNLPDYQLHS